MQRHLRVAPSASELPKGTDSAQTPIRIVLADDHQSIRRNLRALLDADPEIDVIAEVADLGSTTRQVHQRHPRVLIVDVRLANGSALATIAELRRGAQETEIVVMTMEASRSVARQVLDAGALGYILKEQADRDLLPAVRAAASGERYVSAEIYETSRLSSA